MSINTKSLYCLSTSINKPQSMSFSCGKFEFRNSGIGIATTPLLNSHKTAIKVAFSINEIVVRFWSWVGIGFVTNDRFQDVKIVSVVVVR